MSSGALNPIDNAQAWDVIRVGQVTSPGACEVGDVKRKAEWDVKKGKGVYGSTITYVGRPPATCTLKFKLWTRDHFTQWDAFRPLLEYDPTKKSAQAVDVFHPAFADVDLKSVVVESIGGIVHEGRGLYTITVELLEYFPPPKRSAVSTPTTSQSTQGGTTPGAPPDPIGDAQQQQIAGLLQRMAQP